MSDSTFIDSAVKLRGVLASRDQLVVIAGSFEGELEAAEVQLLAGGLFEGVIKAETATISGHFNGIMDCSHLTVHDSAVIAGEITTDALVVDTGADISGTITRKTSAAAP